MGEEPPPLPALSPLPAGASLLGYGAASFPRPPAQEGAAAAAAAPVWCPGSAFRRPRGRQRRAGVGGWQPSCAGPASLLPRAEPLRPGGTLLRGGRPLGGSRWRSGAGRCHWWFRGDFRAVVELYPFSAFPLWGVSAQLPVYAPKAQSGSVVSSGKMLTAIA